jgi:hypothetical protein
VLEVLGEVTGVLFDESLLSTRGRRGTILLLFGAGLMGSATAIGSQKMVNSSVRFFRRVFLSFREPVHVADAVLAGLSAEACDRVYGLAGVVVRSPFSSSACGTVSVVANGTGGFAKESVILKAYTTAAPTSYTNQQDCNAGNGPE